MGDFYENDIFHKREYDIVRTRMTFFINEDMTLLERESDIFRTRGYGTFRTMTEENMATPRGAVVESSGCMDMWIDMRVCTSMCIDATVWGSTASAQRRQF